MAQAKLKLDDRLTAVEYCWKAVDKAGENESLASEVLLRMFLILGPDEVLKYCRQKLETDPDSLAANFAMFNLAKINNDYNRAIDYINKCIRLTDLDSKRRIDYTVKKADTLTLAYEASSDKSYLKTAIADYESLLIKMPKNTNILNNLAYLLAENNERLPEALRYAKSALDAMPNNPGFLDTYAYVLHKNGKNSQAAEFLAVALQQYKQDDIMVPAQVYEHKGMIKEGENDKRLHPNQKPIDLNIKCLEYLEASKLVLDLFLGSGSTLITCEKTNRKCYGMEIDEHYCNIIVNRYIDFCKKNDRYYCVKRNGKILEEGNK